jgi:hypothetical protein
VRIVCFCLVSSVLVAVSAAVVLAPESSEGEAPGLVQLSRLPGATSAAAACALPPVRGRLTAAVVEALPVTPIEADDEADDELGAAREELARMQAELGRAETELAKARERIQDLLQGQCVPRFEAELDAWLDGPLASLHANDPELRGRLRRALQSAAWSLRRQDVWNPETRRPGLDPCPLSVEMLRARYPIGVVAELADLFRAWRRDALREPRLQLIGGCTGASSAMVTVSGVETKLPIDDPFVQSLIAEQRRYDRYWGERIDELLGVYVYALDAGRGCHR